ncbi:PEP-CTERM sorting domain-containing protein [Paraglaciecola arctica]|uniref:PEP-CTERM sorting domain-containing protein n=1 Tax=Paraglaciecola arctica TaxID=1128911 RepID=UPI001C06595D|nr:PEP-CTERM sorting domain-containing protein [Paraglaciecola arctica]MBU3002479.1 PEP-CTERM sorting domain-containing protein [Paraglaciecola arctica]
MKLITGLSLLTLCLASTNTFGGAIVNGDFSSCNYSGWQKDTDGFGELPAGNDFGMVNNAGNCSATLNVDHFDPAGDATGAPLDQAWFANTLFQELDLSGAADSTFSLQIDFAVDSESNSNEIGFIADYFLIGLNDGAGNYYDQTGGLGFLYAPTDVDGAFSQVLSFELDNSFVNQGGWFLDFQLNVGVDDFSLTDAFGSTLFLNSVSLTENKIQSDVPEPTALSLLSLGLLGLYVRKKRR